MDRHYFCVYRIAQLILLDIIISDQDGILIIAIVQKFLCRWHAIL